MPLREAVKLRVGLELGVLDLAKVREERRVLAQAGDAGADVRGVDGEPLATRSLGERLRLHVVVLLELEVLHHRARLEVHPDRKSTRLNSSHLVISYAVFC